MKRLLKVSLLIVSITLFFAACSDDDDEDDFVIEYSNLPVTAQTLITTHFSGYTVTGVRERYVADSDGTYYTSYLSGGYEIDFTKSGQWINIESRSQEIPVSLFNDIEIPLAIKTYVDTNFPTLRIVEVDKYSTGGFQIELSNDRDLYFSSTGEFIR